jgi:diguanylate cyclase (GGDEF)-like protein
MAEYVQALSHDEPGPALLTNLDAFKRGCLIATAAIAVLALCGRAIPAVGSIVPGGWQLMKADTALALLFGAVSLEFSEARHSRRMYWLSLLLAFLVTLLGAAVLIGSAFQLSLGVDSPIPFDRGAASGLQRMLSAQTAAALTMLGISTILIRARKRLAVRIADGSIFALCLLVMMLVSGYTFGAMRIFGLPAVYRACPQTLLCLFLLTLVTLLRLSGRSVFSIFLGSGMSRRISRTLVPVLLILPFVREAGRARLIGVLHLPANYATAILASIATAIAFFLLMLIAWRVNRMEAEIRDLTLRDDLTGLYNLRGFYLLAEQALRLARRSQLPVSVLFIDLDNLKATNDAFGHGTGSASLMETAELLKATFRETDVMGRIGGDEFVVVCLCSYTAMSIAAQRLEEASAIRNAQPGVPFPLNFSIGYTTSEEHARQSLEELIAEADKAMYEDKRRKKLNHD